MGTLTVEMHQTNNALAESVQTTSSLVLMESVLVNGDVAITEMTVVMVQMNSSVLNERAHASHQAGLALNEEVKFAEQVIDLPKGKRIVVWRGHLGVSAKNATSTGKESNLTAQELRNHGLVYVLLKLILSSRISRLPITRRFSSFAL